MLDNSSIRVLNFDDSVVSQERLIGRYNADVVDLKKIAPRVRFWMNEECREDVAKRIIPSASSPVTFLGSGDFHHVSNILINAIEGPLTVINFDFHPDWNTFPPLLSCGSWITETLKNTRVKKVILIGMALDRVSHFSVQMGNYAGLKDDRIEMYPWQERPRIVFFKKVPSNITVASGRGFIFNRLQFNELKGRDLPSILSGIFKRLETKRVYVSIDKDCLEREYALTNWEGGYIPAGDLLLMLRTVRENLDIVGADIAGDYSESHVKSALKKIVSYFNHPKNFSAKNISPARIIGVNEDMNLKIMEALTG